MYIVTGDELHVSDKATLLPTYQAVRSVLTEQQLIDLNVYVFFVYTTRGKAALDNPFKLLEFNDRVITVCNELKVFTTEKSKKLLEKEAVKAFINLYASTQISPTDKELVDIRATHASWVQQLMECKDPKNVTNIVQALRAVKDLMDDCEKRVSLEGTDLLNIEGCPMYLFEMPEINKPPHLKIRLNYG